MSPLAAQSLGELFRASARQFPTHLALAMGSQHWSFAELEAEALRLAGTISGRLGRRPTRVGVFAYRSPTSYIGTLGALLSGAAFVPLSRNFPEARTRNMAERASLDAVIVDAASSPQLGAVFQGLKSVPLIVLAEANAAVPEFAAHVTADEISKSPVPAALPVAGGEDLAYLLFTSGSTGEPKGVGVTHSNVMHFLAAVQQRYHFTCADRFSQTFDQTFDLSVFDLFAAWGAGASLHPVQRIELLAPHRYVASRGLTVWFSVPSVAALMRKQGFLTPDCMPTLRWSLFCGEPLPQEIAAEWSAAAPQSRIENLYGPTELTIACTAYRWDPEHSPGACVNGIVPIGEPLPGLSAVVVDENLREVPAGALGELCMSGPQTVPGYWRDPALTAARFVELAPQTATVQRYYRTGDRVRAEPEGHYVYWGRTDQQVKILGHRVELLEIEALIREDPRVTQTAALAWPVEDGIAQGVVAFVSGHGLDAEEMRRRLRMRLPEYMVPGSIRELDEMPLNANGKIDRSALQARLEREP